MACVKKRKRDEEPRSSLYPTCPICMQEYTNRTFLRPCYHSFCFSCIRQWINITPKCPLCKQDIRCIVYNVDDEANTFQEYTLGSKVEHDPPLELAPLTAEERFLAKRARVYRAPLRALSYPEPLPRLASLACITPEHMPRVATFLHRELQAILGNLNDTFIETHVKHILLIPYHAKAQRSKRDIALDDPDVLDQLAEWLGGQQIASQFIKELVAFIKSGLTYRTYTSNVVYDTDRVSD